MFLQNVLEGYFSDPIYGGNKGGAAWKMIGFPGAHYDYSEWVTEYNKPIPVEPVGTARPLRLEPGLTVARGMPKVDVVLVGFGWNGAILAQQLCDAGLRVLALERAACAHHARQLGDDVRPGRAALHVAPSPVSERQYSMLTFRNNIHQSALPMRHLGSFLQGPASRRGESTGTPRSGAGSESDFKLKSHNELGYGKQATAGLTLQDMPR